MDGIDVSFPALDPVRAEIMDDLAALSVDDMMTALKLPATKRDEAAENLELLYGEIRNPHFRRSFTLSRELDPSKIEAQLRDGVLRLHIPKAEEARPRRIEVNVG